MRLPQGMEWVVILVVVLLLFGAKRLPEAARGLGRSLRILKAETKGLRDDDDEDEDDDTTTTAAPAKPAPVQAALPPTTAPVAEVTDVTDVNVTDPKPAPMHEPRH